MKKKSYHALQEEIIEAKEKIVIGAIYCHYKDPNNHYKILGVGIQEATNKICVFYEPLYMRGITFVRDLDNWLEMCM